MVISIIPAALTVAAVLMCFFRRNWHYAGALAIACASAAGFLHLTGGGNLFGVLLCLGCPLVCMGVLDQTGGEQK